MYQQSVQQLTPGMVVAADVPGDDGRPLLKQGTVLTASFIRGLENRGVLAVHVQDGLADDVLPTDMVSASLRSAATKQLSSVFAGVTMAARDDIDDHPSGIDDTVDRLGGEPLHLDDSTTEAVEDLFSSVEALLSEVMDSSTEAGLGTLKTHNNYTFQHSVDVAAVGSLLGYRAGLTRPELRELALGCLLHDIGKTYIDVAIIDKPGPLTEEERAEMHRHPFLGFELVRRMPLTSIYPAHVAYQHHERQDASGYPRGLRGSNKMIRATAEQFNRKRMLLIAEIAAVADVYSALTSDRPYRAAIPHDVVADMIEDMAGTHLNRAVVDLYHKALPRFPVGHWVTMTGGPFAGQWGVVTAINRAAPARPKVRLVVDEQGEQLASPHEVATSDDPQITMALVKPPTMDRAPALAG